MKSTFHKEFQLILFLLFNLVSICFGQEVSRYNNCDLQTKNSRWLEELKKEKNVSKKIIKIQDKIKSDTIYKSANTNNLIIRDGGTLNFETINSEGKLCGLKILILLTYEKRKSIVLDLNKNPEYRIIVDSLNENNVSIGELNSQQGVALFGFRGSSGTIYLQSKNKEIKKVIKVSLKKRRLTRV